MLSIYIVTAIVGGALVLISALMAGHGDGHVEHDADISHGDASVDVHHGHDHDGEGAVWIPFLSLRFWTYCLATFGIVGILLTKFAEWDNSMVLTTSILTGLFCGLAVSYFMRFARRWEASSSASVAELLGTTGKVLVAIRPPEIGKIRVDIKGETIDMLALSNDESTTLTMDEDVVIVSIENDRARVIPKSEIYP